MFVSDVDPVHEDLPLPPLPKIRSVLSHEMMRKLLSFFQLTDINVMGSMFTK